MHHIQWPGRRDNAGFECEFVQARQLDGCECESKRLILDKGSNGHVTRASPSGTWRGCLCGSMTTKRSKGSCEAQLRRRFCYILDAMDWCEIEAWSWTLARTRSEGEAQRIIPAEQRHASCASPLGAARCTASAVANLGPKSGH